MKTKYTALVATLIGCGSFAAPAHAQLWAPDFKFSGFGTLGVVRTDTNEARFGRDKQIYGANKSLTADVDSNLGLQATASVNDWLSGTVQVLTVKRTTENHLTTEAEWGFVKVAPMQGLSFRGGRLGVPMFLVSDSRNIGYANNWLRAPNEVYGLVSFRRLQGFDVTYQMPIGSTTLTVTALTGTSRTKYATPVLPTTPDSNTFTNGTNFRMKGVKGVNMQLETEWATFRIGRVEAKYDTAAAQAYAFTGFGVTVDRNSIFAQAEFVQKRAPAVPSVEADGWYVMGGYRLGAYLPYASYGSAKPKLVPANNTALTQATTALGLRWDAFKSASLKFQLERIDTNGNKGLSFSRAVSDPVTAASASIDFVF